MDKAFGVMDMSNETARFNKAVELFFGMNPTKRFWILLALCFAKTRMLRIIDNYDGTHDGFVMTSMPLSLITNADVIAKWTKDGIAERSVVAFVPDNQKNLVEQIYSAFANANSLSEKGNFTLARLSQMEPTCLVEIAETLTSLSDEWYEHNGQWAFDMLFRKANHSELVDTYGLPSDLATLMVNILDAQHGKVYNPYAGICSLGAMLNSDCEYVGQEYSKTYLIGQLNLLFNSKDNAVCEQGDSLQDWNDTEKFDYIISIPPFGVKCNGGHSLIESDFFYRSAQKTQYKAIGVYPSRICFGKGTGSSLSVIKDLVQNDFIEAVILLPSRVFSSTDIETVMIIVNKRKPNKHAIRFVDASDSFAKEGKHNRIQVEKVLDLYTSDGERSRKVDVSEILANGGIVYPKMYLYKGVSVPDNMQEISLSDLLTPIRLKHTNETFGRVFSPSNSGQGDCMGIVKCSDLRTREVAGRNYREINEDCLVWTKFMKQFAFLESDGNPVLLRADFKAFRVNAHKVNPQYLLAELYKDYFVNQLDCFGKSHFGGHGQYMTVEDFLKCKIFIPISQIGQEIAIVKNREDALDNRTAELVKTYQRKFDDFVLCQRQRKHQVAQVLNEIMPAVDVIRDFVESNGTVAKDSIVSKRSGKTLEDYLSSLSQLVLKVSHMVDKFTADEKFSPCDDFNLNDFLPIYVEGKNTNEKFRMSFSPSEEDIDDYFDIADGESKHLSMFKIAVSREDLTLMLDNLVDNAKKYGFVDDKRQDYEIVISLSRYNDNMPGMACISVCNNGELVSEGLDLDKLFAWGEGHGSGIGCWQVMNIAEHFGGTVTYEEDNNSPYPCVFNIYLPLIED